MSTSYAGRLAFAPKDVTLDAPERITANVELIGGMHDREYTATFDKRAADAGMRLIA